MEYVLKLPLKKIKCLNLRFLKTFLKIEIKWLERID